MDPFPMERPSVEDLEDINMLLFPVFKIDTSGVAAPEYAQFDPSLNPLYNALDELINSNSAVTTTGVKKGRKRRVTLNPSVFDAIAAHALKDGYNQAELLLIWNVASNQLISINCPQRVRLIFSMHPTHKVGWVVVEKIIDWLLKATASKFKPTVVKGVYQLLIMYSEYDLVERTNLHSDGTLRRILMGSTDNLVVPWKVELFCKLVVPEADLGQHVLLLSKMQKAKDVKKTHLDDIRSAIRLCIFMQPNLSENVEIAGGGGSKMRSLKFPSEARENFFRCRNRIQQKCIPHPMASTIFPEFLPERIFSEDIKTNSTEMMLQMLKSTKGIMKLSSSSPMLEVFSNWLEVMLLHKFSIMGSTFDDAEDLPRYEFIFDCCTTISHARQEGLDVVNEWLMSFLTIWDYQLFQTAVFALLPYVNPHYIQPVKSQLMQTFVEGFVDRGNIRLPLWEALSGLMDIWLKKSKLNDHSAPENPLIDGLTWLLDTMKDMADSLATVPKCDADLVLKMISTYDKIVSFGAEINNGHLRSRMLTLPQGLVAVVCLSLNMKCLQDTQVIMERLRRFGMIDPLRIAYYYIHGVISSNLVPSLIHANMVQRNLSKAMSSEFKNFSNAVKEQIFNYDQWYNALRTPQRPSLLTVSQQNTA